MPALAQLLRAASAQGAPLEARAACAIAARICDRIDQPHGGLAPSAIHVSWEGAVTLPSRARAPGAVLAYMAPERLAGHPAHHRSDVYALAIILSEMVLGRPLPSDALERAARSRELLLESDVPVELADVIERATSRDPRDRHATPREMAAWLSLAEEESGGVMSNDDLADWLAARFPRDPSASASPVRRPWLAGAAAVLALCACVVGVALALPHLAGPSDALKPAAIAPPPAARLEASADRHSAPAAHAPAAQAAVSLDRATESNPAAAAAEERREERRARRRRARAARSAARIEAASSPTAAAKAADKGAACPMTTSAAGRDRETDPPSPAAPAPSMSVGSDS